MVFCGCVCPYASHLLSFMLMLMSYRKPAFTCSARFVLFFVFFFLLFSHSPFPWVPVYSIGEISASLYFVVLFRFYD